MLPITVIVPVRNAEHMVEGCLAAIARANPMEIIVVDGLSSDRTLEIARRFPVRILSDGGQGVPAARMMGIQAAHHEIVALIDVDIVLPDSSLEQLYAEFRTGQYDALQAGLISEAGPGYWGQALVYHHNNGRSKNWPGLMATLFKKEVLLTNALDERFRSGEDIEIRWRLRNAGYRLGVSKQVIVAHRFDDTYAFAKDQWLADGKGLARMVTKYGWRAAPLLGIPAAGSARGIVRSLLKGQPRWVPYYAQYFVYNYLAMADGLREGLPAARLTSPTSA